MFMLAWLCSSNSGEEPEAVIPCMMKKIDISEEDTVGLRILGYAGGGEIMTEQRKKK